MHVIQWELLCQGISPADPALGADASVGIKLKLLRLLIQAALANQSFDEAAYLADNPDVAHAVRSGELRSGHDHYIATGYFEGRHTGPASFDEAWYLQRYPDVQEAVKRGASANGLQHFHGPGIPEWRSPTRAAEADIASWRSAIDPARPIARTVASPATMAATQAASASSNPVSVPPAETAPHKLPAPPPSPKSGAKSHNSLPPDRSSASQLRTR